MSPKYLLLLALIYLSGFAVMAADKSLQDPTRPPPYASPKSGKKMPTNFKLSEIRITDNDRQAVINSKRLRKGDTIASYQLRKIEVGYVILANDKGTLRLNLINSRVIRKKL